MITHYILENIRILMIEGFSDEELRSFCFDRPDFKPVHNQLSEGTGKSQIVQRLVEHAYRKELFNPLLLWAKEKNPAKYKKHQPYYSKSTPTTSSRDHGKPERTPTRPYRVMVVDDEPSWQRRLKRILKEVSCSVIGASDYEQAEELLEQSQFDLITIDLNLDKSTQYADGLELVLRARELYGANLPIIIVTGTGNLEEQRRAFKDYGVFDFIQKAKLDLEEFQRIAVDALKQIENQ